MDTYRARRDDDDDDDDATIAIGIGSPGIY